MSDKKTRLKAEFYAQCQEKRYTDMSDATQSLKAKVIATDLGLKYRKIEDLYAEAERCAQIVAHEDEEARIAVEKKAEEERILAERRAVPGELILELVDSETGSSGSSVQIYRRPDGTIYCQTPPFNEKIEGAPSIEIHSSSATVYTYSPSKTFYTSATVGGVTTGGVSTIKGGYTPNTSKSGKGYLTLTLGITSFTIKRCLVPEHVCKAFKRDRAMKYYESNGEITLFRKSAMADTYRSAMFASGSDAYHTMSALSLAVDEERLPLSSCSQILDLIARIINGPWPPTDRELFDEACAQSESKDLKIVETALQTLKALVNGSDLPKETVSEKHDQVQARYDEMLQAKKEAAILEKEENANKMKKFLNKMKKFLFIALPTAAVLLAAVVILTTVVIPGSRYAKAKALLDAGQYEEAITAFEALGGYKDSAEWVAAAREAQSEVKNAAAYAEAEALLEAGKYDEAIDAFEALNGYKDSAKQIIAAREAQTEAKNAAAYAEAEGLLEAEKYDEAIAAFEALGNYRDSEQKTQEAKETKTEAVYQAASAMEEQGKLYEAATTFYQVKDYMDSWDRCFALWGMITERSSLVIGGHHSSGGYTVGLKANGTVVAVGENSYGQCDVSSWRNIVAIAAGHNHTVGLKVDGTVVAVGGNAYGQCDVSGWKDIVAISAGDEHTVGLKADGTVVATEFIGGERYYSGQCDVSDWRDIIAVAGGQDYSVGLKADGTVVATEFTGEYYYRQCDVSSWRDIVAVSVGVRTTVGIKADGTVVATGMYDHKDLENWNNIVAVSASFSGKVGLNRDGTVVALGFFKDDNINVDSWRNIVAVVAGYDYALGLKTDGTVIAVGNTDYGKCNVSDWRDIKLPD